MHNMKKNNPHAQEELGKTINNPTSQGDLR
jgi:hypothetical protein